jgi:Ser/Thr protein kinase RdoA (MazF antagonist)
MPRQGGFKRAVRRRARETGERYTEARAAMDQRKEEHFPAFGDPSVRPFDHAALKKHLEDGYETRILAMSPITASGMTYSSTLRVQRDNGPDWVARVFSSPADTVSRVEGDAEILRFLASNGFPAERLANDEPVSVLDGSGVIVTEFVEGGRPTDNPTTNTPATWHELASLLGRLHALPGAGGAMARDGGSFTHAGPQHDGVLYIGRPERCLAAAMSTLVSVEDKVAPEGREQFEWLRDQVEDADDAEGLSEALTHGNYNGWAAVGKPGNLVIVGWAGAGRGPRLAALAWLLSTASRGDPTAADYINAVVRGYREHVRLTDEELDRLAGVIHMVPLSMACFYYRMSVQTGYTPSGGEGWWPKPDRAKQLAAKAVESFSRSTR